MTKETFTKNITVEESVPELHTVILKLLDSDDPREFSIGSDLATVMKFVTDTFDENKDIHGLPGMITATIGMKFLAEGNLPGALIALVDLLKS